MICEFYDDKSGMNFFMFEDKYGPIYIFNEKDYTDLKEYFLVTKNINIDNLPKKYSPFWYKIKNQNLITIFLKERTMSSTGSREARARIELV